MLGRSQQNFRQEIIFCLRNEFYVVMHWQDVGSIRTQNCEFILDWNIGYLDMKDKVETIEIHNENV
jgi:hypothetical protein